MWYEQHGLLDGFLVWRRTYCLVLRLSTHHVSYWMAAVVHDTNHVCDVKIVQYICPLLSPQPLCSVHQFTSVLHPALDLLITTWWAWALLSGNWLVTALNPALILQQATRRRRRNSLYHQCFHNPNLQMIIQGWNANRSVLGKQLESCANQWSSNSAGTY